MENWVPVFSSYDLQEATIMMLWLKDLGIEVFLLNRKDSVYPTFGEVQLLVHPDAHEQTMNLIQQHGASGQSSDT